MDKNGRIYIAGHKGLAGSAILRNLQSKGYKNIIMCSHQELDLTQQSKVEAFFKKEKPEYVFFAAAKVGGILANSTFPAEFFYCNSMIQNNIIHSAYLNKVKKLLFLGSSCIYPKFCPQPIDEEYLLSGELEPTNEAYAIAKISGLKMCQYYKKQYGANFISCMPTNLYGPHDNFNLMDSHVIPALIRKFHEAKKKKLPTIELWGTGTSLREFIYVDDMADCCTFLMQNYNEIDHINVGTGEEISIKDLADMVKAITEFEGKIAFDDAKLDGTPRKLLNTNKLRNLGWKGKTELKEGLYKTYEWYKNNETEARI